MRGGTRKSGLVPLCFWPGGEAANPDASHPGKVRGKSFGESLLSPGDFPLLSWARSPLTFVNPSAVGGGCRFPPTAQYRQVRVQGTQYPGGVWGENPAFSPCLIDTLNKVAVNYLGIKCPSRRVQQRFPVVGKLAARHLQQEGVKGFPNRGAAQAQRGHVLAVHGQLRQGIAGVFCQ